MKTTLDYALAYIARGWSIIPLLPRTKQPALALAPYLSGAARMTEDDARKTWSGADGGFGIGIITGRPSGIVVIDIDPRNGGNVSRLQTEVGSYCTQETGGGGLHIVCTYPNEHIPCGKTIEPGVDRKGDGGYIVAAPSIHPGGKAYAWTIHGEDIPGYECHPAPLPAWVLQRPQSQVSSDGSSDPWVADALAHPEACKPGMQEEVLTKLCWWAAGTDLPVDIQRGLLLGWARRLPLGNPHDPWTEEHVNSRLDRALEKREPRAGSIAGIIDDGRPPSERALALRERVQTAPAFVAQAEKDAASRSWIAQDFLAPGCWTEIIGVMKEGKTTFVCGLLNAILQGEPYLGRPTAKVSVLYVTEQVGLSFQKTLERGGLTSAENLHILTIADTFGIPWPETAKAITAIARELDCKVIIVDTLARLAGIAEEDEASSVQVLNPLLQARADGIAVIFVRHSRKAGGAVNVAGRGSGAITGEMDVCLYITAPQGIASDYRHLDGVSRLTDTIQEHLEYVEGRYEIGKDPADVKREHKHAPVVTFLSSQGMKWTPFAEIAEAVKESRSKTRVHGDLKELLAEGTVEHTDEGYRLAPKNEVMGVVE